MTHYTITYQGRAGCAAGNDDLLDFVKRILEYDFEEIVIKKFNSAREAVWSRDAENVERG